jgi:hypothetical protein
VDAADVAPRLSLDEAIVPFDSNKVTCDVTPFGVQAIYGDMATLAQTKALAIASLKDRWDARREDLLAS